MSEALPDRGDLIVIAAPSGAGKTTLVHALLDRLPDLKFSISYTTRKPRSSEQDGVDYFFIDEDEFNRMVTAGDFLEYACVFDHWYGTGKADVEARSANGETVVLEIDWQGARQVRREAPDAKTVFILPPTVAELERRLRHRATDSEATIARRLADSVSDMRHWVEFGYIVFNDDILAATDDLAEVVTGDGQSHRSDLADTRRRVERLLAGQD